MATQMSKNRSAYIPHQRVQSVPVGSSLAKQSFRDETDINTIMAKYKRSGILEHVNRHQGDYSDLVGPDDFHGCMNAVIAAREAFSTLPAKIRTRFENDPAEFLEFVANPENDQEMIELGLRKQPKAAATEEPTSIEEMGPQDPATGPVDPSQPTSGEAA